jgi:hypothetical protein
MRAKPFYIHNTAVRPIKPVEDHASSQKAF